MSSYFLWLFCLFTTLDNRLALLSAARFPATPPLCPGSYSCLVSVFPFYYFSLLSTLASRFSRDQKRSVPMLFLLITSGIESREERRLLRYGTEGKEQRAAGRTQRPVQ